MKKALLVILLLAGTASAQKAVSVREIIADADAISAVSINFRPAVTSAVMQVGGGITQPAPVAVQDPGANGIVVRTAPGKSQSLPLLVAGQSSGLSPVQLVPNPGLTGGPPLFTQSQMSNPLLLRAAMKQICQSVLCPAGLQ